MSQYTNLNKINFTETNHRLNTKEKLDNFNFQLKYSPLVTHTEKNPGNLCYIHGNKFGDVSGCFNEPFNVNYASKELINKISNTSFTSNLFRDTKNIISQPPYYDLRPMEYMEGLFKSNDFNECDLYDKYNSTKYENKFSLDNIRK